ncbi:unnamed protein product [Ixodes persulcatus]
MFIQIEATPNPSTLKFIPDAEILEPGQTFNFSIGDEVAISPLAERLFALSGINNLFITDSFISVTKAADIEWNTLQTLISSTSLENSADSEVVQKIKDLIETMVRPAVAQDGGDILYHDFVDGVVYLKLYGACSGCPSSAFTLKSGVENMLKHYIPEVKSVEQVYY